MVFWYNNPMTMQELKRPAKKIGATPLTEEDKYNFLPYISDDADVLPSEADTYKTDPQALMLMKALREGKNVSGQDFTGVNLKGADLSGFNLDGIILSKANLTQTNLSKASLKQADLSYAYMENTNLDGADMTDAAFKGVVCKNCSMNETVMDADNKKYLETLAWLIDQIEQGKIKLPELPQDQLHFLDLRMMDLSQVDVSEIDLSAFVLDGVNLSGTYIDKRHIAGSERLFALKEKQKRIAELSEKTLEIMMNKVADERAEKAGAFGKAEAMKKQAFHPYAKKLKRPPKKEKPVQSVEPKKTEEKARDLKQESRKAVDLPQGAKVIGRQKARVRTERTQLKKRA